jgi:hypothetical protein
MLTDRFRESAVMNDQWRAGTHSSSWDSSA